MWCIVALLLSELLRGSPFEDFTPGCPRLGARDSCESTTWLVVCSDPPPPPQKRVSSGGGGGGGSQGVRTKNSSGDGFIGQNNDYRTTG